MIRVMIVDDSAVYRGLWTQVLKGCPQIQVVTCADSGVSAIAALNSHEVDVVVLDIEMPEMDGLTAIPLILEKSPKVRIILASSHTTEGASQTIDGLTKGASDFVSKPSSLSASEGVKAISKELIDKIISLDVGPGVFASLKKQPHINPVADFSEPHALVIGASTGGPKALSTVLKKIPKSFEIPIFIVQHLPADFTKALGESIAETSGRACVLGVEGESVESGKIYLAPGDQHMELVKENEKIQIHLSKSPPENFCRPAVDPLFRSAARVYGPNLLAVVLTGMGEDGRRGAEEISRAGGQVLAQDEASSVVWGMPGAVVKSGFCDEVLSLEEIWFAIEKRSTRLRGVG